MVALVTALSTVLPIRSLLVVLFPVKAWFFRRRLVAEPNAKAI